MSKNDQKKPETKQEQPAEQQQTGEVKRPMAVHPPTPEERIEALELTVKEQQRDIAKLLTAVKKLDRHHFREWVD